jgi:hypothetical protein
MKIKDKRTTSKFTVLVVVERTISNWFVATMQDGFLNIMSTPVVLILFTSLYYLAFVV